jgi:predicted metal-dependent hydrolase
VAEGILPMTELVVRRLLVDMEQPIERHWCDGDAFRSALLNALSMSFPVGEQFFIDSVRGGFKALPAPAQAQHQRDVQGFIGQEATHRRLHELYNAHLERLGYDNRWERRAKERLAQMEGADIRHGLAITAANEHFTAILAEWILSRPEALGTRDPRLATLWLWHSAEESEHRAVAFDLYRALGGDETWRLRWFRRVTAIFLGDTVRQTALNLRHDGLLWKWSTWQSAAKLLFGRGGLVREVYGRWRDYRRADFHPQQHDDARSRAWLAANAAVYAPVGR